MEINERNKEFYELAFIENGEFGYGFKPWKPSIDERTASDVCCDKDGKSIPATSCGYRDYSTSRKIGLQNIFDQYPSVKFKDDSFRHIKRADNTLKLYDKITIDDGRQFIVVGDDEDKYYIVDKDDKLYCVDYEKEE